MKRIILFLMITLWLNLPALAERQCFLAKENNQVIQKKGECKSRHSPCSTFKIAISLMSYNEGLLVDEAHPELPFKEGYVTWLDKWKQPHNPTTWMNHSCVWYSQVLTNKLGLRKFKEYVRKLAYGNQDVAGDRGKNNGLTHAWLSSSLEISPQEQVEFLQKLLANKLPVSAHAHAATRNILFLENLPGGWKLYGKTGNGFQLSHDRKQKLALQLGWFVGWVQKGERTIIFASYQEDDSPQDTYASVRAKAVTKERLKQVIGDFPMEDAISLLRSKLMRER